MAPRNSLGHEPLPSMNGRHRLRLEALEARVAKTPRGTPEQLKAQRAWAQEQFIAWMNAATEAAERGEVLVELDYPEYPGEWIAEPIDERSVAAVRPVMEYINNSLKIRGAQSEHKEGPALDRAPVERPTPQAHKYIQPEAHESQQAPRAGQAAAPVGSLIKQGA
jgi:hypothetical protein